MVKVCNKEVTLPDPKDNRAVFDYVKNFLLEQNEQSSDGDPIVGCVYRLQTENGTLACAAGSLIPDEEYHPDLEGCSVWNQPSKAHHYFYDRGYNIKLISALQRIHDGNSPVDWPARFDDLEHTFFVKNP